MYSVSHGTTHQGRSPRHPQCLAGRRRARVPAQRRVGDLAGRHRGRGGHYARRHLLALPGQGGPVQRHDGPRAAADGARARLRRLRPRRPPAGSAQGAAGRPAPDRHRPAHAPRIRGGDAQGRIHRQPRFGAAAPPHRAQRGPGRHAPGAAGCRPASGRAPGPARRGGGPRPPPRANLAGRGASRGGPARSLNRSPACCATSGPGSPAGRSRTRRRGPPLPP